MANNAYERECIMCGKPLFWFLMLESWVHGSDNSIWCEGKASVATPSSKPRTEGTQRYIDSGEYEGEYGKD